MKVVILGDAVGKVLLDERNAGIDSIQYTVYRSPHKQAWDGKCVVPIRELRVLE